MRILYVEDDPRDADLTVRTLHKAAPSFEVETVSTYAAAVARLDQLEEQPFDLLMTDVHLPDGNGLALLRYVREHALPLAVVVVAGMGDEETAVTALKARADDYVAKSKDYLQNLVATLESAHNHYSADAARRAYPLNVYHAGGNEAENEETRKYFSVHFDHINFEFTSNAEAIHQAASLDKEYEVVVLDLDFEELEAFEFLRELFVRLKADLPVVLICEQNNEELARRCLDLGATSYVLKRPGYLYKLSWVIADANSRAELLRREAALRASEDRNHAILNAIPDVMFLFDRSGNVLDYHERDRNSSATAHRDFLGKTISQVFPPDVAESFSWSFERARLSDNPQVFEYSLVDDRGARVYEASTIRCEDDKLLAMVRDITERKQAEYALQESHAELQALNAELRLAATELERQQGELSFVNLDLQTKVAEISQANSDIQNLMESTDIGTIFLDRQLNIKRFTPQILKIFNVFPPDLKDRFSDLTRRLNYETLEADVRQVLTGARQVECEVRSPNGCCYLVRLLPYRTAEDGVDGVVITFIDITEGKKVEDALRDSEERLVLAQKAARIATWEWNLLTGSAVWSEMLWSFLGLEPGSCEMNYENFIKHIHPEGRDQILQHANEAVLEGDDYSDEFRIVASDGNVIWVSSKGRVIRGPDGIAERMIGVNIDITERKLAEDSLKQALAKVQQLKDRLYHENIYLQEEIRVASNFDEIIGHSDALQRVLQSVEQVAPLDTTVLVLGETGTGKELLAHAIHSRSRRKSKPLVKVNCAALPVNLIESELFGHTKGAFTGANAQRVGRFEVANNGTIFLDEIGELPLDLQAKLLRVLEEGEFERVGDSRTINVNVRVIAATNRNLENAVREGRFRSDLYYRLSVFPITLPPLRERREDIPLMVKHFVKLFATKFGKEIDTVPVETMATLRSYPWPGNIRELRNVIERAVIVTSGSKLRLQDSVELVRFESDTLAGVPDTETLESSQYNLILRTLKKTQWRIEGDYGAAAALRINPSTLRTRMKKLGIIKPGGAASH